MDNIFHTDRLDCLTIAKYTTVILYVVMVIMSSYSHICVSDVFKSLGKLREEYEVEWMSVTHLSWVTQRHSSCFNVLRIRPPGLFHGGGSVDHWLKHHQYVWLANEPQLTQAESWVTSTEWQAALHPQHTACLCVYVSPNGTKLLCVCYSCPLTSCIWEHLSIIVRHWG